MPVKKVVVASLNPAKINAVKSAFIATFHQENFEFVGVSVASGVADQPMSNSETHRGALNRVKNAKCHLPDADYYVGLEAVSKKTLPLHGWSLKQTHTEESLARPV